ncbi:hypothetical protein EZV62_007255 [Acer yangbiense]|uniref:Uncharacterized protein n=1 Tax=Acer yangbiense TaxID=1000413 RepID=A0A5C7I9L3_9ROSI|nr:hypothetical protein EZV62_007255 [Acer yangbiense]
MGRELTNVNMDKNPFGVTLKPTSNNKVHVAPKISEGNNNEAKDYDVKECSAENSVAENCQDHEKEDVTSEKPEDQNSSSPTSNSSEHTSSIVLQPSAVSTEKDASDTTPHVEAESAADGFEEYFLNFCNLFQPSSPLTSKKLLQLDKKFADEEDNYSVASSTATSVRRITIGTAPKFRCSERLEKRKEGKNTKPWRQREDNVKQGKSIGTYKKDESSAGNATKKKIRGQNNGNGTVKVKEQVKQAKEMTKASSKKISDDKSLLFLITVLACLLNLIRCQDFFY